MGKAREGMIEDVLGQASTYERGGYCGYEESAWLLISLPRAQEDCYVSSRDT